MTIVTSLVNYCHCGMFVMTMMIITITNLLGMFVICDVCLFFFTLPVELPCEVVHVVNEKLLPKNGKELVLIRNQ